MQEKQNHLLKLGSIAACFAVIIVVGALVLPSLLGGEPTPGGTNDRYKDINIMADESGIVWPWEYQTVFEKYTEVTIDGIVYRSHGRLVSEEILGDLIGTYTVLGIDEIEGDRYTEKFEVYQLKYADKSQVVAVRMEGSCYTFKRDNYEPPHTLGELFKLVDLPKAIELKRFSVNGDSPNKNTIH